MYWNARSVQPLEDYQIQVILVTGREGIFDLKPYLDHGVFRELKDVEYFKQVRISLGTVCWPHGQDIAPETLIAEMVPADNGLTHCCSGRSLRRAANQRR